MTAMTENVGFIDLLELHICEIYTTKLHSLITLLKREKLEVADWGSGLPSTKLKVIIILLIFVGPLCL